MHISTQGLVLREVNYKESDKLLTVLTAEGGKRTVKAGPPEGSPLAAAAQLLVYSDMTLFEYRTTSPSTRRSPSSSSGASDPIWRGLSLASYFAEVMEAVAVGRPDPMALSLILNSLYALDRLEPAPGSGKGGLRAQAHVPGGVRAPAGRLRGVARRSQSRLCST